MTDRKHELTLLLEKVEAGSATSGCFNQDWHGSPSYSGGCGVNAHRAYGGSLDAAQALHEAVLPGWDATVSVGACHVSLSEPIGKDPLRGWYPGPEVESVTPARAWLIAILKALI